MIHAPNEPKRGFLFLLSHMRCYTTALCHVLGSHPEVDGYFESHIRYHRQADLVHLMRCVHDSTDGRMSGRFVLDKILHNYHINREILNRPDVHVVVMLRKPQETLSSVIRLGQNGPRRVRFYAEPANAMKYYIGRLRQIRQDLEDRLQPPLLLTAESLRNDIQPVLDELSEYLQLSRPLKNRYSLYKHSGKVRYGDTSERLQAGAILPGSQVDSRDTNIDIDPALVRLGDRAYRECLADAHEYCKVVS